MKRILIDSTDSQTRTALMDGNELLEIYIDKESNRSLIGHVFVGLVLNILPSQIAFVNIGQDKAAFLSLKSKHQLKIGQPVLVQVHKDASGSKGATIGTILHINGRLSIIYESDKKEVGISQKITFHGERDRLRGILKKCLPQGYGAIARTNSENQDESAITEEINRLVGLHKYIVDRSQHMKPPTLVYQENTLIFDMLSADVKEILINNEDEYLGIIKNIKSWAPEMADRVKLYNENDDIQLFSRYNVERQITEALERKVWLPCGGYVTFEQTEACVIIDVNTGRFLGKKSMRETILYTNLEAAACIAHQIRLRNSSGMIIVDFIDMDYAEDTQALTSAFKSAIKKDRIRTTIVGMTQLGLMQLTRRKTRDSLSRIMEEPCPVCKGTGVVC